MQWHHEVVVACLSVDEVHTPPGDPQDKLHLLKTIINTKRKYEAHFWNSPEILNISEKSHLWWVARFLYKEQDAERINSFGLMVEELWLFEVFCKFK